MNIIKDFIGKGRPNRIGKIINVKYITVHNTSNTAPGAGALTHSKFVRLKGYNRIVNGEKKWVSWHFTVDDKHVIQQLPLNEHAIHAGAKANNTSIGIEVCMNEGINQDKADKKAALLIAILCKKLKIDFSNIVNHKQWTGKNCPVLLLQKWNEFKKEIQMSNEKLNMSITPIDFLEVDKEITDNEIQDLDFEMCSFEDHNTI